MLFPSPLSRGGCKCVPCTLLAALGWAASSSFPDPAWPLPLPCQALRVSPGTVPPSAWHSAAHSPAPWGSPVAGDGTLRAQDAACKADLLLTLNTVPNPGGTWPHHITNLSQYPFPSAASWGGGTSGCSACSLASPAWPIPLFSPHQGWQKLPPALGWAPDHPQANLFAATGFG